MKKQKSNENWQKKHFYYEIKPGTLRTFSEEFCDTHVRGFWIWVLDMIVSWRHRCHLLSVSQQYLLGTYVTGVSFVSVSGLFKLNWTNWWKRWSQVVKSANLWNLVDTISSWKQVQSCLAKLEKMARKVIEISNYLLNLEIV